MARMKFGAFLAPHHPIGWSGARPSDDEAPLYADNTVAAAARARNPGTTVHFRLFVIADLGGNDFRVDRSAFGR